MRRVLLAVGFLMISLTAVAGEFLMNETGQTASGLRVMFSEPVTITGFGDILMSVNPAGEADEFLFSGGAVESWGGHWLNWEPVAALITSYEWLVDAVGDGSQRPEDIYSSGTDRFRVAAEDGWWSDVLYLGNGSGGYYVKQSFGPEAINWSFTRPWSEDMRYVPASRAEYQETYDVTGTLNPLYSTYEPDMARTVTGETISFSDWGGGYYMDPHAVGWADRVLEGILSTLGPEVDGVSQDNIGVPPFIKGGGGFSEHEKAGFRDFLSGRRSEAELRRFGIVDLEDFDIAEYILDRDYIDGEPDAVRDSVFREFILYQNLSNLEIWAGMVDEVLGSTDRDVILPGNQYAVWTPWDSNPYSVLLSQLHQVIEIEFVSYLSAMPPVGHYSLPCKIGLASGFMEKPVWIRGIVFDWETRQHYLEENFLRLIAADVHANGAVRTLEQHQGGPDGGTYLSGRTLKGLLNYYEWVRENESFFRDRASAAKTAIVYSIPTMMWRYFPTTGHWSWAQNASLSGFAFVLEAEHIPYDVVVFGHPDLWDDAGLGERLAGYDVVILPDVDCLSGHQIQSLEAYVDVGGSLLYSGSLGSRDENYELRPSEMVARLGQANSVVEVEGTPGRDYHRKRMEGLAGTDWPFSQILAGIDSVPDYERQILTDAPETIGMNAYLQSSGGFLVHMINYDYDKGTDELNPSGAFTIRLNLPDGLGPDGVKAFWTGDDGRSEELVHTVEGGRIVMTVPGVECHSILAIGAE